MTEYAIAETWRKLSKQQLGTYAEYFVKMQFTLKGFSVYSPEIDDRSIDFVVAPSAGTHFFQVQVKAMRGPGYAFVRKRLFPLSENRVIALAVFHEPQVPDLYLVPSTVWRAPNKCFVSRDFGPGRKSEPEWGIEATKRHLTQTLEAYRFEKQIEKLNAV